MNSESHPGLTRLTKAETDCLLLVAQGHRTSSIADRLDRSEHTINNQIKSGRAKLGGVDRSTAARMVAAHSQKLASHFRDIGEPSPDTDDRPSPAAALPDTLAEERAVFGVTPTEEAAPSHGLEAPRNGLNNLSRVLVIAGIAIAAMAAAILAVPLSDSFQRLANAIEPPKAN